MYEDAALLGLYAETAVHPGSGQSGGAVDLPVQRERHTGLPLIQATSIKGVLRDEGNDVIPDDVKAVFGPGVGDVDLHGGALSPTDARLLLFPARSLDEVFVWTTCPLVIERLRRDLDLPKAPLSASRFRVDPDEALLPTQSALTHTPIILEDDAYTPRNDAAARSQIDALVPVIQSLMPGGTSHTFFVERVATHLVVLADADFAELTRKGTDVVTRIKLNAKKTTTGGGGGMWVEEFLPSDCLFYSVMLALKPRVPSTAVKAAKDVLDAVKKIIEQRPGLQIGGDETVGRGWMRARWHDPGQPTSPGTSGQTGDAT
jgi:CRISPR-associated protein Cmr4